MRLGKRTKRLVKRLDPGDIAVIDHAAIDRVSGEDLVASGVKCVLNSRTSASPRYGNQGPVIMTEAGIHLVDMPDAPLFDVLKDGDDRHRPRRRISTGATSSSGRARSRTARP